MTEKYRAIAIEGTPDTPCAMARLLVKVDNGSISILTPEGPAENGVTRERFRGLADEGFATWLSPREEGVEVEKDWYALYLREELAEAMGGFKEALGLSLQPIDIQTDNTERFVCVPEGPGEMRESGLVIILGTSERLWRLRKEWAEKLRTLNHADNMHYLRTEKPKLLDDLEEKRKRLNNIEERARLGLFCADPKMMSVFYLNFALELGLVMMRLRDPDTCYRIYKYHVERDFPRMSWGDFKKQVRELQGTHILSLDEFPSMQLLKGSSEIPESGNRQIERKKRLFG